VIKCGKEECVEKLGHFKHQTTEFRQFTVVLRITPVEERETFDLWLRRDRVPVDVFDTSQSVSPERAAIGKHMPVREGAIPQRRCTSSRVRSDRTLSAPELISLQQITVGESALPSEHVLEMTDVRDLARDFRMQSLVDCRSIENCLPNMANCPRKLTN
jgi:hypothetical protein